MNQGEVSATDLKSLLDRGEVTLIDVREPSEYRICQIPGAALIPLGELPRRVAEIDQSRPVVVHCKSGARSAQAVAWLRRQGFTDVRNMRGGILAWINEVDPSLPKY
jgi:adenylyltransferase/sulfurtransferase